MDQNEAKIRRNRALVIIGIAATVIILILYLTIFNQTSTTQTDEETGNNASTSAKDSASYDINEDKLAATPKSDFTALTDAGVTSSELDALQFGLYSYAQPQSISVRDAKAVKGSVEHTVPDINSGDRFQSYRFVIQLDSTRQVGVELRSDRLYSTTVKIFDLKTKTQLFDSGIIDTRKL